MALMDIFRNLGGDDGNILQKLRITGNQSALASNYRTYGSSFEVTSFEDFIETAIDFYHDAMASDDPYYTKVKLPGNRVAIDYNSEVRGVFSRRGRPFAFFRPDYHALGFANRQEELEVFKSGKGIAA